MPHYCVIGAGAAGISALEQLRSAGHSVDCLEKTDRVGGHWHTDYDALHLITSRDTTHFENFPMPAQYPHFPRRDQIRDYIESYALEHGHYDIIQFDTEVTAVQPVPASGPIGSAGWKVSTSAGSTVYDGVIIANGHLWDPRIPAIPGTFTGTQLHSKYYRNVDDLADEGRVLVVGAGNSGCDLAADAAAHRRDIDIVMRHGIYFQPKTYFGVPRQEVDCLKGLSPAEVDFASRQLARVSIGEAHNYPNMPIPVHKTLAAGATTVNDLVLYWIHHGRISVVPGIASFDGLAVTFTDGSVREYSTILWATGFESSVPFVDDALIQRMNGHPKRYGAGIVPAGLEKLYYVGMIAPRGPQIPIYGVQAKVVNQMIALHEAAGPQGIPLAHYLAEHQAPEDRIDIVRDIWLDQLADTERLLAAYTHAAAPQTRGDTAAIIDHVALAGR
jgi:Flavin-binding monooxygenase-like